MTKSKRMKAWILSIVLMVVSVFEIGDVTASAAKKDVKIPTKPVTVYFTDYISEYSLKREYGTAKVKFKKRKGVKIKKVSYTVFDKYIVKVSAESNNRKCKNWKEFVKRYTIEGSIKGKTLPTLTLKAISQGSTRIWVSVKYRKGGKTHYECQIFKVKVKRRVKEVEDKSEENAWTQPDIPQNPSTDYPSVTASPNETNPPTIPTGEPGLN